MVFRSVMNGLAGSMIIMFDTNKIKMQNTRDELKGEKNQAANAANAETNAYFISGFTAIDLSKEGLVMKVIPVSKKDLFINKFDNF
jgi:hypothetical protein